MEDERSEKKSFFFRSFSIAVSNDDRLRQRINATTDDEHEKLTIEFEYFCDQSRTNARTDLLAGRGEEGI